MTIDDYLHWLASAQPGSPRVYHTGLLSRDRGGITPKAKLDATTRRLADLADAVRASAERGLVALTQRRLDDGRYEYIAIRTSTPRTERRRLPQPPQGRDQQRRWALAQLDAGAEREAICDAINISRDTLRNWLSKRNAAKRRAAA